MLVCTKIIFSHTSIYFSFICFASNRGRNHACCYGNAVKNITVFIITIIFFWTLFPREVNPILLFWTKRFGNCEQSPKEITVYNGRILKKLRFSFHVDGKGSTPPWCRMQNGLRMPPNHAISHKVNNGSRPFFRNAVSALVRIHSWSGCSKNTGNPKSFLFLKCFTSALRVWQLQFRVSVVGPILKSIELLFRVFAVCIIMYPWFSDWYEY